MPEIPNVISNEVIASEWGNDIRDRTIQRYATAAARTALHAAPVAGDLSFLADTGKVYVYYSGAWRVVDWEHGSSHGSASADHLGGGIAGYMVTGHNLENSTDNTLSSTYETGASAVFTMPASWSTCDILSWGTVMFRVSMEAVVPIIGVRMNINGVAGTALSFTTSNDPDGYLFPASLSSTYKRIGVTGSGSVAIQYAELAPAVIKDSSIVSYIAIRTG